MTKPLVKNASSERQTKRAKNKENLGRKNIDSAFRKVLATDEGMTVLWHILEHCSSFSSIWHPSAAIHYNSGRQDVGHWLMAEMSSADKRAIIRILERNAQAEEKETG